MSNKHIQKLDSFLEAQRSRIQAQRQESIAQIQQQVQLNDQAVQKAFEQLVGNQRAIMAEYNLNRTNH